MESDGWPRAGGNRESPRGARGHADSLLAAAAAWHRQSRAPAALTARAALSSLADKWLRRVAASYREPGRAVSIKIEKKQRLLEEEESWRRRRRRR